MIMIFKHLKITERTPKGEKHPQYPDKLLAIIVVSVIYMYTHLTLLKTFFTTGFLITSSYDTPNLLINLCYWVFR